LEPVEGLKRPPAPPSRGRAAFSRSEFFADFGTDRSLGPPGEHT